MVTFIALVAVLIVAGVSAVAIPLVKRSATQAEPAPVAALVAAGVLVIGSAVLYASLSNWSWKAAPAVDSPQNMVSRLARQLEKDPNNMEGWLTLGRSYLVLEQYPLALRAYQRADGLAGGKNADALVGQAEALTLSNDNELDGHAGQLIEQALVLEPTNEKALFFGAAAAVRRGELSLGRTRFASLLASNPPDNIKSIIQQQIAAIDARTSSGQSANPSAGASGEGASTPTAATAVGGPNTTGSGLTGSAAAVPPVRVKVDLAPSMAQPASNGAPLFVFVRDPTQPGAPLAVKRLESHFPQTVELTGNDSMVPGRIYSAGQKVEVVARISRSGSPTAGSGDPFGEAAWQVGRDGTVNIVIDQVTP